MRRVRMRAGDGAMSLSDSSWLDFRRLSAMPRQFPQTATPYQDPRGVMCAAARRAELQMSRHSSAKAGCSVHRCCWELCRRSMALFHCQPAAPSPARAHWRRLSAALHTALQCAARTPTRRPISALPTHLSQRGNKVASSTSIRSWRQVAAPWHREDLVGWRGGLWRQQRRRGLVWFPQGRWMSVLAGRACPYGCWV